MKATVTTWNYLAIRLYVQYILFNAIGTHTHYVVQVQKGMLISCTNVQILARSYAIWSLMGGSNDARII